MASIEDIVKFSKWLEDKHKHSEQFFLDRLDSDQYPEGYARQQVMRCGYAAAIARVIREFIEGDPVAVEAFSNIDSDYGMWEAKDERDSA